MAAWRSAKQERTHRIGVMRAEGRTWVEIAEDFRERYQVNARVALRLAHGWSQARAAEEWCRRWPDEPRTFQNISTWERWPQSGHAPSLSTLGRLARVYRCSVADLVADVSDFRHLDEADGARSGGPAGTALVDAGAAARRDGGGPEVDGPGDVIGEAAEESAALGEWAGAAGLDEGVLEELDREVRSLAHAYVSGEPYPLMVRTRILRARMTGLMARHHGWRQARDLCLVSARASTLLAWMTGDLGRYAAAREHARTAWVLAEQAGHGGAAAWARAAQSKLAYWDGDNPGSAALAADGLRQSCGDSGRGLLALLEARAAARLGRAEQADAALRQWVDEREHGWDADQVGGVLGLTAAQQHYLAGTAHLWLGSPGRALEESDRAVALFESYGEEERFYGAEALCRGDVARARLGQGDLDGAADAVEWVLSLPAEQRLNTSMQSLRMVATGLRDLRYRDSRLAGSLVDRIREYERSAVGNAGAVAVAP